MYTFHWTLSNGMTSALFELLFQCSKVIAHSCPHNDGQFHIGELIILLLKKLILFQQDKTVATYVKICRNQNKVKEIVQFVHLFEKSQLHWKAIFAFQ